MFYFDHQSVLIEIKVLQTSESNVYLIGDEIYENVPQSILDLAFVSANWNRALKFFANSEITNCIQTGYYMIDFDIYLDFNIQDIKLLTKTFFFQKILEQTRFKKEFMKNIFKFKNRNKHIDVIKPITNEIVETYNLQNLKHNKRNFSLQRNLVTKTMNLTKYRFKDLFILDDKFYLEITNKNQRIYHIPAHELEYEVLSLIDYVDLNNNTFYINTELEWNHNIKSEFYFENQKLAQEILIKISATIEKYLDDKNLFWHLYNISNDKKYLLKGIKDIFENTDFKNGIEKLESSFRNLKLNYLNFILEQEEVVTKFQSYVTNQEEQELFDSVLVRYKKQTK
ncbi:hypothetical protein CXP39_00560 [Mesoplasma syrphidae]|uniref:Uncharacterized protein n=1 Tax=Mesoplasma syrphidae TaxID=225999 RepID=A0A2K9BQL1_9MOLU|nr:hypothetical protein [Mesoplasma syrphidae]AUF83302.1 hypothetical protein CXP39_00560 [Mesoplasma syrphidae]